MRAWRAGAVALSMMVVVGGLVGAGGGPAAAVTGGTAVEIAAGGYQGCAVTPTHRVKCWGDNDYGQLGIGGDLSVDQLAPVQVLGLRHVKTVAVGDYNACAVLRGGKLKCWGNNDSGTVGDGTVSLRATPVSVIGLSSGVVDVAVGGQHACALVDSGRVKCWGLNDYGQLGIGVKGGQRQSPETVPNIRNATQISAGLNFSCATVDGRAKCWGANGDGQLGDGTRHDRPSPVSVSGLRGVEQVVAGYFSTCAIFHGGQLKCWGGNYYGEVGTGATGNRYTTPAQVVGMTKNVTDVDVNYYFTCAVQSGAAKCWGRNDYGQIAAGDGALYGVPSQVRSLGSGVASIDISWYTGCALMRSGAAKCWGWNGEGEVGNNSAQDRYYTPQVVLL